MREPLFPPCPVSRSGFFVRADDLVLDIISCWQMRLAYRKATVELGVLTATANARDKEGNDGGC